MISREDIDFLGFIAKRLVSVYDDSEDVDSVIKMNSILSKVKYTKDNWDETAKDLFFSSLRDSEESMSSDYIRGFIDGAKEVIKH